MPIPQCPRQRRGGRLSVIVSLSHGRLAGGLETRFLLLSLSLFSPLPRAAASPGGLAFLPRRAPACGTLDRLRCLASDGSARVADPGAPSRSFRTGHLPPDLPLLHDTESHKKQSMLPDILFSCCIPSPDEVWSGTQVPRGRLGVICCGCLPMTDFPVRRAGSHCGPGRSSVTYNAASPGTKFHIS